MSNYRKSKRPLKLLRGYSLFLNGSSDIEILNKDVKEAELAKTKHFHASISKNKPYTNVCFEINIDKTLGKRMMRLFQDKQEGKPVSCQRNQVKIRGVLIMLLDRIDQSVVLEKYTEAEINKAKEFLEFSRNADRFLLSDIGKQFGVTRASVSELLKVIRRHEESNDDNCMIPISSRRKEYER